MALQKKKRLTDLPSAWPMTWTVQCSNNDKNESVPKLVQPTWLTAEAF